jgi:hypothetical protein
VRRPGNRVVEIRVAPDVVLGPRGDDERKVERPRRLDRRHHPLDRVRSLVQASGRVEVLDRASDRPGLCDATNRARCALGRLAVAVLEIDGERQLGGGIESSGVRDHVVESRTAVEPSEREREA